MESRIKSFWSGRDSCPPAPEPPLADLSDPSRWGGSRFLSYAPLKPPPRIASTSLRHSECTISDIDLLDCESLDPYGPGFEKVYVESIDSGDPKRASRCSAIGETNHLIICFFAGLIFASFACALAFVPVCIWNSWDDVSIRRKRYYVTGAAIGSFVFAGLTAFLALSFRNRAA